MATKLEEYLGRTPVAPSEASTAEMAPLYRTEQPAPVPAPEPATPATDYARLIADKGYFGAFRELYPKQDLTDEYKRTKKQQQMALLADIANVGSQLFASSRGARKFTPVQSQVPTYEDRMQRLRDAQRAYDADYASKSLSAAYKDYTDKQAQDWKEKQLDAQREAAANKLAQDMMKFNANLTYKQAKDAADRKLQKERNAETKRHNEEMEALSRQRAENSSGKASDKSEIAYSTKYGDVILDNPKNKRAITLSVLEVMRNGADGEERKTIDNIIYRSRIGDVDSYNDAEMYVSQHLNSNAIALRHLYELAGKYGHVSSNDNQRKNRDAAMGKVNSAPWVKNNNQSSTTAPWLQE